jgi:hypothetical protein
MSGLGPKPSPEEVRDALERIRKSTVLRTKTKPLEVLAFIVNRRLEGGENVKIDQKDIATAVWPPNQPFDSGSTLVRNPVTQLRDLLPKYYATAGKNDPVWIELPEKGYVPIFTRKAPAPPPPPDPEPPPPPPGVPPPQINVQTPIWKRKPVVAGSVFTLGVLLVLYWFSHDRHCGEGMRITSLTDGASVMSDEVIQGTRTPREWLCRCKDYLVVEPVGLRDFYIQEKLLGGPDWSATARFGDPTTVPGTRFSVFVLSTTANLPIGALSPSSKLVEGAKRSRSVQVTLRRLAAWIRIGNTAGLVASQTAESDRTLRDEFHGIISGTASSGEASVFVLYRPFLQRTGERLRFVTLPELWQYGRAVRQQIAWHFYDLIRSTMATTTAVRPDSHASATSRVTTAQAWRIKLRAVEKYLLAPIAVDAVPKTSGESASGSLSMLPFPRAAEPISSMTNASWLRLMGRLKAGEFVTEAESGLRALQPAVRQATLSPRLPASLAQNYLKEPFRLVAAAGGSSPLRDQYSMSLMVLMGVVLSLLFIRV